VLATLEVINEGVHKGTKYEIRTPLTHVGRGAHNDVVIADESVSDSHAKIQRRETGWYVVDMGSTNGTYVGGRRIVDEKQLVGAPDIRLGGIKMIFHVAADAADDAKGTRAIAGMRAAPRPAPPATRAPAPAGTAAQDATPRPSSWIWLIVMILIAGAVFFTLWGGP
jgi:pSer/pThr/pTyr-binding forkhead associated (FHA) protein